MTTTFGERTDNLLASGADCLVNATNTLGVMGAGIARQFALRWPEMYADYQRAAEAGELQVGRVHAWFNPAATEEDAEDGEPDWIVNLHTMVEPGQHARYSYVVRGLLDLAERLGSELGDVETIAVPALGCGIGGLEWSTVEILIRDALSDVEGDLEVWLYPPQGPSYRRPWRDVASGRQEWHFLNERSER